MRMMLWCAAAALALAACQGSPTRTLEPAAGTPAFARSEVDRQPVDLIATSECPGHEYVHVAGIIHTVSSLEDDGEGGLHFHAHVNFSDLHGEGLVTGARYVSQETINFSVHFAGLGQSTTRTDHFNLIGQGHAPNEVLQVRFHVTRNANGTVTSFADEFNVKCAAG